MGWNVKASGAYATTSEEALENCTIIYQTLYNYGWTLNAVAGFLGNVYIESGYNPWRWQNDSIGISTGSPWTDKGYGLTQFTNASKYIDSSYAQSYYGYGPNFSDKTGNVNDGYAQLQFVNEHADYYATSSYPESYSEFKASTESASYLAKVWIYNYERPSASSIASTLADRQEKAEYWYSTLGGVSPTPTPTPTPTPAISHSDWIFYMRKRRLFR